MMKYRKFIVGLVGTVLIGVAQAPAYSAKPWATTLLALLTALGVYQVPNV